MPRAQKTKKPAIDAALREADFIQRRHDGELIREIATAEGISTQRVSQIVLKGLKRTVAEPADALRQLMLDRLNTIWHHMLPIIEVGGVSAPPAANAAAKAIVQACKIMGLDAPMKLAATTADGKELTIPAPMTEPRALMAVLKYLHESKPGEALRLQEGDPGVKRDDNGNGNGKGQIH